MNAAFRFYALLFLGSVEAEGFVFQPHTPPPSSTPRQLQLNENKSDVASTDFLDEVVTAILTDYPADNLSKFAALIDALLAHASASSESTLHSNWSSTIDRSDVSSRSASEEKDVFDDVGNDFIPFPELSSMDADANLELSSMDDDASVSIAFDDVTGSASGGLENTIGDDANMRDGEDVSNNAAVRLLSGMITSIVALHAFILAL